jgi:hypothetical protein
MTLRHRICSGSLLWSRLCRPRFGELSWRLYRWSLPKRAFDDQHK